ncbi:MAG: tyrosine-type recombinase/integrase [Opitutaceae bacterium]|nr:tyrosine-type recombinase/integrase [Opitutaceae bacterium]
MPGRRPLTPFEERQLLRIARNLNARDQALITTQWMTGFRISEVLSLRIRDVLRNGAIVDKIGITPRNLKGGYGRTRWVPVQPELHRALSRHLGCLRQRIEPSGDLPLFLSRQDNPDGSARAISRESARTILHEAFLRAGITDDGRLGTHTLRKTWARSVYEASGRDIVLLRAALNHSDVSVTQAYLEVDADRLDAAMRRCDFTRGPQRSAPQPIAFPSPQRTEAVPDERSA